MNMNPNHADYYGEQDVTDTKNSTNNTNTTNSTIANEVTQTNIFLSRPPLVLAFGVAPLLDVSAGFWNWLTWHSDTTNVATWSTTYEIELYLGASVLASWGLAM